MQNLISIILAAGSGSRMASSKPKVLYDIAGKSVISRVIDAVKPISKKTVIVIGHKKELIKNHIQKNKYAVNFAEQIEDIKGTGAAVKSALLNLALENSDNILVCCGDAPLIDKNILSDLYKYHLENISDISVLTAELKNPYGYGRINKDASGHIISVIEESDANPAEKKIKEVNSGVYIFKSNVLEKYINTIKADNNQKEIYLTDIISLAAKDNLIIKSYKTDNSNILLGINTLSALADIRRIKNDEILTYHMERGVEIYDPATIWIDESVIIEKDVIIMPNVIIKGDCVIKEGATIGPFAYLRPGSRIGKNSKVGTFVEIKQSDIGENTKIPHLSYVGDAYIGDNTNIGAGTIFANYDGVDKHKTSVGSNCKTGANNVFVAPVKIYDNVYTAGGSVIRKDVKPFDLALSYAPQKNISNWVKNNKRQKDE